MVDVCEHHDEVDGGGVFWRSAPGARADSPVLYVHGVPNDSEMWLGFLQRTGGIALDLPGFGRSAKRGDFDYSIGGYDRFLERFLEHLAIPRVRLVLHDWGAVALAFAQRRPDAIARLAVIDAVPLLGGYRWHRLARVWRTPGAGELAMGLTSRWTLRLIAREKGSVPAAALDDFLDQVLARFDPGTQRAILRLYRSANPDVLQRAGAHLAAVTAPALVLWGERDCYVPSTFADAYGAALGAAEVVRVPDAGHWPWLDDPGVCDRVARFLAAD